MNVNTRIQRKIFSLGLAFKVDAILLKFHCLMWLMQNKTTGRMQKTIKYLNKKIPYETKMTIVLWRSIKLKSHIKEKHEKNNTQ